MLTIAYFSIKKVARLILQQVQDERAISILSGPGLRSSLERSRP